MNIVDERLLELNASFEVQNMETGESQSFSSILKAVCFMELNDCNWMMTVKFTSLRATLLGQYTNVFPALRATLGEGVIHVVNHYEL